MVVTSTNSISGKKLASTWPQINTDTSLLDKEYEVLKKEGDDPAKHPVKTHIENLSYELQQGNKRLRFFAITHLPKSQDINYKQYEILERKFRESPPDLVLIEGSIDFNYPFSREEAVKHGEQTFMCYLVQMYNKQSGWNVTIESGDLEVNTNPDDEKRDRFIVTNAAGKFEKYDSIDMVFGSGHAIRQKEAWKEFFYSTT